MPPGGSARHRLCPVYVFRATGSMPGSMPPVLFFSSVSYYLLSVDLGPQGAIVHVSCQAVVRVYSLPAKLNTLSALLCVWCGPQ